MLQKITSPTHPNLCHNIPFFVLFVMRLSVFVLQDNMFYKHLVNMYSRLSRCSTAKGLGFGSSGLVPLRLRLVSLFYSLKVPLY